MSKLIFSRLRFLAFGHDVVMIPLAWIAAYWFRFNLSSIPDSYVGGMVTYLPAVIAIQVMMFWYFGLYRGVWRFASIPDLVRITKAVALGAGFIAISLFLWTRMVGVPRSVLPLYAVFLVILVGGPRFIYRWFKDHKFGVISGKSALIIGAGRAGEILARDLIHDQLKEYTPVAFLDDALGKQGKEIHGIRVVGSVDDLPRVIRDKAAEVVLLAIPSANSAQMRRMVDHCEEAGVPFRTLPKYSDLVSGRVSTQSLREVAIDDLLGREQVKLDWSRISHEISGSIIMVSGAGGSIGSELCRQIARLSPEKLLLVDHSEYALYSIEKELREVFPNVILSFYLTSVTDKVSVDHIFSTESPAMVFHAAAYKHVPMLQGQSREAAKNNILGTYTLAKSAVAHGCHKFVMVSTDKAVNPSNIMGATKRMAEMSCQTLNIKSKTRFITVRFGNVLGSAGSVVPLFRKQIAKGGPVTVTHPDITRFFMTIPEACQLVMEAGAVGKGGEIFVLDMGEPVKISYLADQMIRLAGKIPGEDVDIVFTGLRPGEKLYEELFYDDEPLVSTDYDKIKLVQAPAKGLDDLDNLINEFRDACDVYDNKRVNELLWNLIPQHKVQHDQITVSNVIPMSKAVK